MHILSTDQIRSWDRYTIEHEPVESIDLMERAAQAFTKWFLGLSRFADEEILVVAGTGNNGGDGLAIARLLTEKGFEVTVCICQVQPKPGRDFLINLERLKYKDVDILEVREKDNFHDLSAFKIIIDGIFGTGLSRPVTGYWAKFIQYINSLNSRVFAIDIPSGMFGDRPNNPEDITIQAHHCLSFEVAKLSFFFRSNSVRLGNWEVRSIGLMPDFVSQLETGFSLTDPTELAKQLIKRDRFSHKGHFGHALIAAGSKGMTGAAVLSSKACLRSGAGMVTALIPDCGYTVLQTTIPEVMTIQGHGTDHIRSCPDLERFNAIGIGPGLGVNEETKGFLAELLKKSNGKLILDADALNILAENPELMQLLPKNTILTPHPGEFRRLFGSSEDDLETLKLLSEKAKAHQCIIVLKGAYTAIADVNGHIYFNNSGNAGMSTAGSGDVLTGMICGLLSQGYGALYAAKTGVYLHGLAGDLVMEQKGMEAMISGDLVEMTGNAFKKLYQYRSE